MTGHRAPDAGDTRVSPAELPDEAQMLTSTDDDLVADPPRSGSVAAVVVCAVVAVLVASGLWVVESAQPWAVGPNPSAGSRPAPGSAGAAAPADTAYPVPSGAIVVSPHGRDGAAGTVDNPLRTIWEAVNDARDGSTVVIRAGVYHETIVIPDGKRVTLQAYPREAVWLDGSEPLTGWRTDGPQWVADWSQQLDASPTYTWGAPDNTKPGWNFVNPAYPMAAHPEQVWVAGVPQRQVSRRDEVTAGTFYLDTDAGRLYLGSDPTTTPVSVSSLRQAVVVQSRGSALRGLRVRRYADSVPHQGAVTLLAPDVSVENVSIEDSATTGLGVLAAHADVRHITVAHSGMLGIAGFQADGTTFDQVRSTDNNTEHFNHSPAAGGLKITRSRGIRVTAGEFSRNDGSGLWADESSYDLTLAGNDVEQNGDHGIVLEISAQAVIGNNRVVDNAHDGILVADSDHVSIWNNTLAGNERDVNLTQDDRDPLEEGAPGHDSRRPFPDPTVTWRLGSIEVHNNLLAFSNARGDALLGVEDFTGQRRAEDLAISLNGNAYVRRDATSPQWAVVWASPGADPRVFTSLDDFRSATRQELYHYSADSADVVDDTFRLLASTQALADSTARPLPDDVATALGKEPGTKHVGAWTS